MTAPDFVDRGRGLVSRGQYQEAVKVCRLGLLANPTHVEGRLVLGQALMALRRFDEVLAEMRVALEVDGTNARAMALRGEALLRKGDALQASDMLRKAAALAPGDAEVGKLLSEAQLAVTAAGPTSSRPKPASDFGEAFTKHYPAHSGLGAKVSSLPPPESKSITRPSKAVPPRPGTPPPEELAVGERTGTIELDPELEGVEMVDSGDRPMEPPIPAPDEDSVDSVVEIDSMDVVMESSGSRSRPTMPDEPTANYRRSQHGPRPSDDFAPESATTPEVPHARPPGGGRADPSALVRSAARVDELFPEDESGVSRVELDELPPPQARHGKPGVRRDDRRPPGPGEGSEIRRRSMSEDMRTIRAGLGLEPTGERSPPEPAPPRPRASARPQPQPGRVEPTEHVAVRPSQAARPVERTVGVPRSRLRSITTWLYITVAAAVLGGAVFGGLALRRVRLDRQIRTAETEARGHEETDTLAGYQQALAIRSRIAASRSTGETRAALARARAALAAEFGEGRDEAATAVDGLDGDDRAEALAARAYLALADTDATAAQAAADALVKASPDSPLGPYLRGRAALLAGQADVAADSFREALRGAPRPLVYVGLGLAEAARGKTAEALAAFDRALELAPGHPAPLIHRARVLARTGGLPPGNQPDDTLLGLVDGSAGANLSPEQRAWAGLALAEIKLARNDLAAAGRALDATRDARPTRSWEFTRDWVAALIAVGNLAGAKVETERAQSTWPQRPQAHVLAARVAMARGDAEGALQALGSAGDLSKDAEGLALRGRARLARGQTADAIADLDEALRLQPGHRDALAARSEAYLRTGNAKAAADLLAPLYAAGKTGDVALLYAAALRASGARAGAREVLEPLLAQANPPPRALLELARLERDGGNYVAAGEAFARAMQVAPGDPEPRLEAAVLALDTGDRKGAREAFQTLVDASPEDGRVLVEAARAFSLAGDTRKAEELIARAEKTRNAPGAPIARERGRVLLRKLAFRDSVSELGRAVSLDAEDGETRLLLIDAYLSLEDEAGARAALREVLKKFPGGAESHLAKGRLDLYKERIAEALESFRLARSTLEAAKAPPRQVADALQWIGRVHYYAPAPQLAKARAALEECTRLDPGHAEAYYFLGLVELDDKRYRAAVTAFEKSVAADPTGNPESWYYLGEAAALAKLAAKSRAAYQAYLERCESVQCYQVEEARRRLK